MDSPTIELITCESGDWKVIKLDEDTFEEGRTLSNQDWMDLIFELTGIKVGRREISDDEMACGDY